MEALSLSPKFCDQPKYTDKLKSKLQFENLLSQTDDLSFTSTAEFDHFRSTVLDCCRQFEAAIPKGLRILTKQHNDQLKELRNNNDLIITRPDKGSVIVFMNRKDYVSKMEYILDNPNKFYKDPCPRDNTEFIEQQLIKMLKQLLNTSVINQEMFGKLKPSGSNLPRLYGLPKTHKQGVSLRPILDMVNSPYHQITQ